MITFIKRAEKRYNYWQEDGELLSIEVSYHYGHNKYMYELHRPGQGEREYGFDTFIDAMDEVCYLIGEEYRVMDQTDLELERELLN